MHGVGFAWGALSACQETGFVSFEKQVNATHSTRSVDDDGKRPFGPYTSLPDPSGAGPAQASKVFQEENSRAIPTSRGYKPTRHRSGGQTYTLNLVDASVTEGAKAVLGEISSKASFTVDPKVEGRITIRTDRAGRSTAPASRNCSRHP